MLTIISMIGILCSGCPFDVAHVTYTASTFQPLQCAEHTFVLLTEVDLTDTPCGYSRTLRKATRWDHIGNITEGDVYRSRDQVLILECSNVHEAYVVLSGHQLIGFFLPVEKGFVPHLPPMALPLER